MGETSKISKSSKNSMQDEEVGQLVNKSIILVTDNTTTNHN